MKSFRQIYRDLRAATRFNLSLFMYNHSKQKRSNEELFPQLRNKYAGRRCFVVCNGPSLKPADLDKLAEKQEITFASNKIDKIFNQTKWRPTLYSIIDEYLQFTLVNTANNVPAEYKFFRQNSFLATRKVKGQCVWMNADGDRGLLEHPKFSENANEIIYTIATVTYAMLELAVYLGMREIYIIGCDNSYGVERKKDGSLFNNGQPSYFAGASASDNKNSVGATWEMNVAYEYARKYADAHGIKIYNATRGGHLEAFERVDFDSLF